MGIQDRENELFHDWKKRHPLIVPDGIANEEEYLPSNPKIVFLLKEVNADKNAEWDLRKFLRDGRRSITWDNIARWVIGIRNITEDLSWVDIQSIEHADHKTALNSIAGVNLKKTPGGGTTISDQLYEVAEKDSDLLRKQLELYSADLVVCCGSDVTNLTRYKILQSGGDPWELTRHGVEYYRHSTLGCFLGFSHPAARVNANLLFYGLMDAVREIFGIKSSSIK